MHSGLLLSSCPCEAGLRLRGYWRAKLQLSVLAPVQSSVSKLLLRHLRIRAPCFVVCTPSLTVLICPYVLNSGVASSQSSKSPSIISICNHTLARRRPTRLHVYSTPGFYSTPGSQFYVVSFSPNLSDGLSFSPKWFGKEKKKNERFGVSGPFSVQFATTSLAWNPFGN